MTDSGAVSPDSAPADSSVVPDPGTALSGDPTSPAGASDDTISTLADAITDTGTPTGPDTRASDGAVLRYGVITAIGTGANALHVQTDATGSAWLTYDVSYAPALNDLVYLLQQGPIAHVGGQLGGTQPTPPPVGMMAPYCGTSAPPGWVFPLGQALSRTTYSALFALCGTTYGAGDGSTTFNVPNLTDRMPVGSGALYARGETGGSETRTLTTANLPSHDHTATQGSHDHTGTAMGTHDHPGTAMAAHDHPGSAHSHTSGGTHSHTMTHDHTGTALAGHNHSTTMGTAAAKAVTGGTQSIVSSTAITKIDTSSDSAGTPNTTIYSGSTGGTDPGNTGSTTANVTSASAGTPNTASASAGTPNINSNSAGAISIGSTGSGTAFNNMPPYLGVSWILRVLP